jgi:rod shape-determining protein MreC
LSETRRIARKVLAIDSLLQIKRNYFPESVAARIIARSPSSWHQEVIIDKGRSDNLRPGMVVVTEKGILGQIQDSKPDYAIVQLMSSSQIRFGAIVRRASVMGILFGDKGGYAQLKFIPIGSDIQKGDIVQTSGISPNGIEKFFPIDYPVGKVIEVSKDDNNSEMFIRVKLFEDGYKMTSREVLVLMPWGNKSSLGALQKIPLEESRKTEISMTPSGINNYASGPPKAEAKIVNKSNSEQAQKIKPKTIEVAKPELLPSAKPSSEASIANTTPPETPTNTEE